MGSTPRQCHFPISRALSPAFCLPDVPLLGFAGGGPLLSSMALRPGPPAPGPGCTLPASHSHCTAPGGPSQHPLLGSLWWQEAVSQCGSLLSFLVPQSPLTPSLCPCPGICVGLSPVLMLLCIFGVLLQASSLSPSILIGVSLSFSHSSKLLPWKLGGVRVGNRMSHGPRRPGEDS